MWSLQNLSRWKTGWERGGGIGAVKKYHPGDVGRQISQQDLDEGSGFSGIRKELGNSTSCSSLEFPSKKFVLEK